MLLPNFHQNLDSVAEAVFDIRVGVWVADPQVLQYIVLEKTCVFVRLSILKSRIINLSRAYQDSVTAHQFKGQNQVLWSNVTISTD